jgi:phosphoglucomutase
MYNFRQNGLGIKEIHVRRVRDYLPEADILYYDIGFADDWIAIRPSGTEPKLKIYVGSYGGKTAAEDRCEWIAALLEQKIAEWQS